MHTSEPSEGGGKSDGDGDPTQTVPNIPPPDPKDFPGMEQKTDEGAEQAARYFITVAFWAHQTGGAEKFEPLFNENCKNCATILGDINKIKNTKQYWSPFLVEVSGTELGHKQEGICEYYIDLIIHPHTEPNFDGTEPTRYEKEEITAALRLTWMGDRWVASGYGAAPKANGSAQ